MDEKVLLVDDEPDVLRTLSAILTQEGFGINTAQGGQEALEIFQSEPFDVVITDMKMPGTDGMGVMKRVKELDENTEVIILTGFGTIENAVEALRDGGAFGYLSKPLEDIDKLLATLHRALEKRKLRIENKLLLKELKESNEQLKNEIEERKRVEKALREALSEIKILSGILPICCSCKKIRDDKGDWKQIETYIRDRTEAQFSHSICPECIKRLYPDLMEDD